MKVIGLLLALPWVYGKCSNMTIRKEARDMNPHDWQVYSETIIKASSTPEVGSKLSIWEVNSLLHVNIYPKIHDNCIFFYFHRKFIRELELKLQKINSEFFWPYWDEGLDHGLPESSSIWKHIGTTGYPVKDGSFRDMKLENVQGMGPGLLRNFTFDQLRKTIPSNEQIAATFAASALGGYPLWWPSMNYLHGYLHDAVNGHMLSYASPSDPLFYLHHSYYDLVWDNAQVGWKTKGIAADSQYDSKSNCSADTLLPYYRVKLSTVLDLEQDLCVQYQPLGTSQPLSGTGLASTDVRSMDIASGDSGDIEFQSPEYQPMESCPALRSSHMVNNKPHMLMMGNKILERCRATLARVLSGEQVVMFQPPDIRPLIN